MYCKICGMKLEKKWSGFYDINTGKKEMIYKKCINSCCNNKHDYGKGLKYFSNIKCLKCGREIPSIPLDTWEY